VLTWLRAALLFGVAYLLIGRVFALPTDHVQAWRIAAWLVCGVAYAAHIGYEHFRLRNAPRLIALSAAPAIRPAWLLALVAWPVVTAVPAYLGALVAGAMLRRFSRRNHP
jgi:hypothetical protein